MISTQRKSTFESREYNRKCLNHHRQNIADSYNGLEAEVITRYIRHASLSIAKASRLLTCGPLYGGMVDCFINTLTDVELDIKDLQEEGIIESDQYANMVAESKLYRPPLTSLHREVLENTKWSF